MVKTLAQNLVKTLAKNLVKNLAKNLVKNLNNKSDREKEGSRQAPRGACR